MSKLGLKKNQDIVSSALMDDELVLLNVETGNYFVLDRVAARIWELFDDSISFDEIVKKIVERYEVSFKQAEDDIHDFLKELQNKGIVEIDV